MTLEVAAKEKLRPGMFASVFLETETRDGALVIPKTALALESIGDTVYVMSDGVAERREVTLGFREGDAVEILSGLEEGEQVVSVGQDGLSDGTPIQVLGGPGEGQQTDGERPGGASAGPGWAGWPAASVASAEPAEMTPEQIER